MAAANTLLGKGQKPTIRTVREVLGKGSFSKIYSLLTEWEQTKPHSGAVSAELPPSLIGYLLQELERIRSEARAEIGSELVRVQSEAADLAAAGEALENEQEKLLEQIAKLTSERDRLIGQNGAQETIISNQATELEREKQAAESLRIQIAQAANKVEIANEKVATVQQENKRLTGELAAENTRFGTELANETAKRVDAEQKAAVAQSRGELFASRIEELSRELEKARAALDQERATTTTTLTEKGQLGTKIEASAERISELRARVDQLAEQLEKEEGVRVEAQKQVAALSAKNDGLKERVSDLQKEAGELRKLAGEAEKRMAQLKED